VGSELTSFALLLRQPRFFSESELRQAAERAWNTSFAGEERESKHCIVRAGKITMMKAGPHALRFLCVVGPYVNDPAAEVSWLPRQEQRAAWLAHKACFTVDYVNAETDLEMAYCVLSQFVRQLRLDEVLAIYLPRERWFVLKDEAVPFLERLSMARDAGVPRPRDEETMR
jgi:hypothetical protein